jgi:hypothetical protein
MRERERLDGQRIEAVDSLDEVMGVAVTEVEVVAEWSVK